MKTLVLALVCLFYNAQAQPVPTESRIAMAMGSRAAAQNYKSRWLAIHNGESAVQAYALGNIRSKIVAAVDMLEIECDMNKGGRGCFATSVPNWSESRGFGNVRNQELMMKAVY